MSAERVGHPGERLAEMLGYHLLVRDVVGDLSQSVHVVRECDQTGPYLVLGEDAKCMAYDGGAGDFAERTDMRQARWAITGLEDHLVLGVLREPRHDLAGFLERPGVRLLRKGGQARGIRGGGGARHLFSD